MFFLITGYFLYHNLYKRQEPNTTSPNSSAFSSESRKLRPLKRGKNDVIEIEMLPVSAVSDQKQLVEITDKKLLARLDSIVPGIARISQSGVNTFQAVKASQGEVLYRALLPASAKLAQSKEIEGAVRGIYMGKNGRIAGHANFEAIQPPKPVKAMGANAAGAVMSAASMVVGQYYMAQIDKELGTISTGISQIQNFQDNEYRSRVFSLISHVKNIADFRTEIIEEDELRKSKIYQLNSFEPECTRLLKQANFTLDKFTEKENLNYGDYEKTLSEAHSWFMYQKYLLEVLYQISDLLYTLHLGRMPREMCISQICTYMEDARATRSRLSDWHRSNINRLNIEIENKRRRREGFDGMIHLLPGLFDEKHNFLPISNKIAEMITDQSTVYNPTYRNQTSELYTQDVQLISKNGKVYYLPESNEGQKGLSGKTAA